MSILKPKNSSLGVASAKKKSETPNQALNPSTASKTTPILDNTENFKPKDILFQKGDPGGDLFVIESGIVEIYTEKDGHTTIHTEMKAGEIIGIMTCLTNEARMASARAKTTVLCKKIPHEHIMKAIKDMPPWLSIVIKEYGIRLKQANEQFADSNLKCKKLEANALNSHYTAAQIASSLSNAVDFFAKHLDDQKVIFLEETIEKLSLMLNRQPGEISEIFTIMQESALIRVEVEPERKRKYIRHEQALALINFANFIRESKSGAGKKLVRSKFSNREFRVAMALVNYARKSGADIQKTCSFDASVLKAQLEKVTGSVFETDAIQQVADLELLKLDGAGPKLKISFNPQILGRTMTCLEAYRRLAVLDQNLLSGKQKG